MHAGATLDFIVPLPRDIAVLEQVLSSPPISSSDNGSPTHQSCLNVVHADLRVVESEGIDRYTNTPH